MSEKNNQVYDNYFSTQVAGNQTIDQITRESFNYFNQNLLKFIPAKKEIKILEIGCGFGRYLKFLKDLGYTNLTGLDISSEQIKVAKQNFDLENVFVADAIEYLDKNIEKFDVILVLDVVEHLDLEYALNLGTKMYQSLTTGGTLIMQTPNGLSPLSLYRYGDITHVRALNVQSSMQYLTLAGFTKMSFHEAPPDTIGLKNKIRQGLWKITRLFIMLYIFIINGNFGGKVYTPNIISVASK